MKFTKAILTAVLFTGLAAGTLNIRAADKDKKPKPYPLKTCVVSDEEIGKDPGMKPHVFTHQDQEVKLCCKSCLKDFNKEPVKYLKKIEEAAKKEKK